MPLRADVRAILTRAMKARKRLDKLARTLKRRFRAGDSLSPRQLRTAAKTVATSGYHGAQLGMKDFDQFLTFLQSGELQPLEFGKRSAEEMAALRQAWDEGVGKAEKAGVAIKPGSATSLRRRTTGTGTRSSTPTRPARRRRPTNLWRTRCTASGPRLRSGPPSWTR